MQLHEARQLADLLDVPLIEVLKHAGIALPEEGSRVVPVIGYLDKTGELHLHKERETTPGPEDLPSNAVAVRCETARSEYDLLDGWVFFADKPEPPQPGIIGRFCLVNPKKSRPTVAVVERGYKAGTYNLLEGLYFGALKPVENTHLDWATPVLWIRTPM